MDIKTKKYKALEFSIDKILKEKVYNVVFPFYMSGLDTEHIMKINYLDTIRFSESFAHNRTKFFININYYKGDRALALSCFIKDII